MTTFGNVHFFFQEVKVQCLTFSNRFLYILFSSAHFVVIAFLTKDSGTLHLEETISMMSATFLGSNRFFDGISVVKNAGDGFPVKV